MFSEMSTGTCCRPLWMAMVSPTMSGNTMERRDQVLIGRRSFALDAAVTFFARCVSTNGPFLTERGTFQIPRLRLLKAWLALLLLLATANDHLVRSLVRARLVSLGRRAPRAYRVSSTGGLAFAAAVRMVDRVHRHTAYCRSYSSPALRTGLAELSQVVFAVSDFAHRRAAFDVDTSCFAGAQSHRGIRAFTRRDLRAGTRGANELAALARLQLYAM